MTYKNMKNKKIQIVKDYFKGWETGKKELLKLSPDLKFTSPDDCFTSSAGFLDKCWQYRGLKYDKMDFVTGENIVCVRYSINSDGKQFENCEWITVEKGEINEIIVFYGSK